MKSHKFPSPRDDDQRIPLPPGTLIKDKCGIIYKIKNTEVKAGGSALLYQVEREGSLRNFVLKECYPRSKDFNFVRKNGVVYSEDEQGESELDIVKKNMRRENEIGQLIANKTGRTVAPWETLTAEQIVIEGKVFPATDSCFIVMEQAMDGETRGLFLNDLLAECALPVEESAPLRTGGVPAPFVAARIIEELLKSLRDVHFSGYIHGDINDVNFFLMGAVLENADIGVGQLLDFGNSFRLESDGKTAPIKNVFSTYGFGSPEIFANTGEIRLSPATDIFSVGALMLYLLKGMRYKNVCGKNLVKNFSVEIFLPVKKLLKYGYRREAAVLFRKILAKALSFKPEDRYQDAAQMLKDVVFLRKLIAPPKFSLSVNLSRSPNFVNGSRNAELAALQQNLDDGAHPLWIWGLGGQGKTELAMEFARKQIEQGRAAYLVTFRGSLKETIMSMDFSGWSFEFDGKGDAADKEYRARLDLLKENYRDALLIVDNFDDAESSLAELQLEPAYKDLLGLNMKILFTTRSRPNDSVAELAPLSEENSLTLFKSIAKVSLDEEKIVRKLIREVDYHPMTIEILARTLNESWGTLSTKNLLARLRSENINSQTLPEVKHMKALNEREAKLYGHLRTLFNLFRLEDYRDILCDLTLLPIEGFDAAEFLLSESSSKKKRLKRLEGNGWARRRAEDNLLRIHPLIRSVFKNELKPTNVDCKDFLSKLWSRLDDRYPPDKKLFRSAAEFFERAAKDFGDVTGEHNFHAGYCCIIGEKFVQAALFEDAAVKLREKFLDKNDLQLARTYNDAGTAAFFLQDYDKGMDYLAKALKVLETNAPDDPNAANIFANAGNAHMMLGDYEKGVELTGRAVEIFSRVPPKNPHERANAYRVFGMALMWCKRYDEAMENFFAAEKIFHELAPEGSVDLALICMDIGEVYSVKNEPETALNYLLKALALQEKFLPKNHNDKMFSYHLLGETYRLAGNEVESKKFFDMEADALRAKNEQSSRDLLKTTLDFIDMHADKMSSDELISRYRTVADSYCKLGELDNSEKYIALALEKISYAAPLEVALTYFSAADIHAAKKNLPEALEFARKSAAVVENSSPNNFGFLSTNYLHLANLYNSAGNFEEALDFFKRAEKFQLKCVHPDFDMIRWIHHSCGTALKNLKRFDEAEKTFENLLAEWSAIVYDSHPTIRAIQALIAEIRRLRAEK